MPNKKLAPNEQSINAIVDRDLWKEVGVAAALAGKTKREALEEALKMYLNNESWDKAWEDFRKEQDRNE